LKLIIFRLFVPWRRLLLLAAVQAGSQAQTAAAAPRAPAKNVMLFISDGASWGTWHMASYYEHGALGRQPYDAFSVKLGMTTTPLTTSTVPTGSTTPTVSLRPGACLGQHAPGGPAGWPAALLCRL
jgi:alkaline phosphatase